MADLSNFAFINSFGDPQDSSSADSPKYASFKTATYELTDVLLGKVVNAINSSSGAGDAAKFVLTNGSGKIDDTFINFNSFDKVFAAKVATTAVLPAVTYDNGTSGVGATLTADANGALADIDGQTLVQYDRLLVKNQATGLQNGIYEVSVVGDAGTAFVLTRVTDYDESDEVMAGDLVVIDIGTDNADKVFILTSNDDLTVGTDALVFASLGTNLIEAGDGLSYDGTELNVNAGNGIKIDTDNVAVEPNDFAGSGVVDDGSDNLAIDWFVPGTDTPASVDKAVDVTDLAANGAAQGAKLIGADPATISQSSATTVQGILEDLSNSIETVDVQGVTYTVGTGGVSAGDVVYISANDTVVVYATITADQRIPGLALTTESAAGSVKVLANDEVIEDVLTALGVTAGDTIYWSGSALTATAPSSAGSRVIQAGIAKNADDLHVEVRAVKKNA